MAQKTARKKEAEPLLMAEIVPIKNEEPFLKYLQLEFAHANYSGAGSVTKGEISANLKHLELGVGMGALDLDYYGKSFFVTPRFEVNGQPGNFDLYLGMAFPFILMQGTHGGRGGQVKNPNSLGEHAYLGGSWEILNPSEFNKFGLRFGAELRGRLDGEPFEYPGETLFEAEAGVAAIYEPVTLYAKETVFFEPDKPYEQGLGDRLTPHHEELKAGLLLDLDGMVLGAEIRKTPFETGGEISVEVDAGEFVPRVSAWGSHGGKMFGNEAGFGLSMAFGGSKVRGKARYKKGFGNRAGEWSEASRIMEYPRSLKAALADKKRMDAFDTFSDAILGAETFEDFKKAYKGKSRYAQLYAAQYLGFLGHENYDYELEGGGLSGITSRGARVEEIGSEGAYGAIRNFFSSENRKKGGAGTCVNINLLPAEFLRSVGMEAYPIGINGGDEPHIVTIAKDAKAGKIYLVDYDDLMEYRGDKVWPLVQAYAKENKIIVQGITLYGKDNSVVGYYKGPEGKLMDEAAGHSEDRLNRSLLKSRPKKR